MAFEVEHLGDDQYLVTGDVDGDRVEKRFYLDPACVERLGLGGVAGDAVVRATVDFLLDHQRLDELPAQVEVEDVTAAYDDFEGRLRAGLGDAAG